MYAGKTVSQNARWFPAHRPLKGISVIGVGMRYEECEKMDESDAQARQDERSAMVGQDADSPANEQNEQSSDTAQDVAAVKKRLFVERTRIEQLGRIRQLVFGSLDGLLVPLGVVSAVAGGTHNTQAIIVAGVAEAFAGALSMGAGEFISGRSEAQVQQSEIEKERQEIERDPEFEKAEMRALLENEGMSAVDAAQVTETFARYPDSYHKTMVEKELGLQVDPQTVKTPEALTMSASYLVGSFFPLIAYFFLPPVPQALIVSILLTIVALVIVGVIKGRLANLNLFRSALEVVVVGTASALGGYLLGVVIPHLLGY
jgi:vacuolar iron transporter family protein